jgi:hypothetical protein
VPDPSGLAADFAAVMQTAKGKRVADVSLRVWTPGHASVRFVNQVAPSVDDRLGGSRPRLGREVALGEQMAGARSGISWKGLW